MRLRPLKSSLHSFKISHLHYIATRYSVTLHYTPTELQQLWHGCVAPRCKQQGFTSTSISMECNPRVTSPEVFTHCACISKTFVSIMNSFCHSLRVNTSRRACRAHPASVPEQGSASKLGVIRLRGGCAQQLRRDCARHQISIKNIEQTPTGLTSTKEILLSRVMPARLGLDAASLHQNPRRLMLFTCFC